MSRRLGVLLSLLTFLTLLTLLAVGAAADSGAKTPLFLDRTADVGVDFRHWNGMSGELYYVEMMGAGGALFDFDDDGDLDLYLVQGARLGPKPVEEATTAPPPGPLRDRLYRNDLTVRPDGSRELRFTDVTAESGLDARGYGMGATTGDVDNDGDIDLYVTNFGPNELWLNQGDGTFREATAAAGAGDSLWSIGAAFFDADRDGWLDLFIANYVDFRVTENKFCPSPTGERDYCGPLAYDPEPDRLLRSRGRSPGSGSDTGPDMPPRFEDITARAGLGVSATGMGVTTGDFDDDGWPDLYVANDAMANHLWLHRGIDENGLPRFVDEALLAGTAFNLEGQPEASMGVAAGDVDGDGRDDLLVTHLIHETNTLYLNRGEASFLDATVASGLGTAGWLSTGFGTAFSDIDNDGWLDLIVLNGAVRLFDRYARAEGDKKTTWTLDQPNHVFKNRGGGRFEDVSEAAGPCFAVSEVSRGLSIGDLDNDGDPDVVVHNNHGPARILLNQVGAASGWLGVRLVGGPGEVRDAIGARAELTVAGRVLRREVRTAGSYASASDPRLLFGLGDARGRSFDLRVRWPNGREELFPAVPAGRYTTLSEGEGTSPTETVGETRP